MNEISLNILAPCKGCTDRELHCHSKCGRYQEYRSKIEQRRTENAEKNAEIEFATALKREVRRLYSKRRESDKRR